MAENAPVMHRDFPRWHAAVAVGNGTDQRDARWAAVRTIAEKADALMVEALVRIAFGTKQPPSTSAFTRPRLDCIIVIDSRSARACSSVDT